MNSRKGGLSDKDYKEMDDFLGRVLEAYKNGEISKKTTIASLAHVMAALDTGNTGEAIQWFRQEGVKFFIDQDRMKPEQLK